MCMVSMTHDYGHDAWGKKWHEPQDDSAWKKIIDQMQEAQERRAMRDLHREIKDWFESFKRAVEAAERFDQETAQPHCEDPMKLAWVKSVEARLKQIEEALAK